MIYHFFALSAICFFLAMAGLRRTSIYSPLVINSVIWLVVFASGLFFNELFYPLTDLAFLAWIVWFFITSLLYLFMARPKAFYSFPEYRKLPFKYSSLLMVLIVLLVYRVWVVGSSGPEHFFLNLRLSSNGLEGFEPLGMISRFYPLVFSLFLFEHVYSSPANKRQRILLWVWMLAYAVATMGKFAILTPILSWVIIQGVKGQLPKKNVILLGFGAFLLMMAAHFVRAGDEHDATIFDVLAIYIYSPLVAFGYMETAIDAEWGAYVFRFLYAVGSALDLLPQPTEVILPYVEVPTLTNVYTVMQPFYYDFALAGVFFGAILYGLFFGIAYYFSVRYHGVWLAIFSAFSIALVGQFIGDMLLTVFSGNLQVLICLVFVFLVSRRCGDVG